MTGSDQKGSKSNLTVNYLPLLGPLAFGYLIAALDPETSEQSVRVGFALGHTAIVSVLGWIITRYPRGFRHRWPVAALIISGLWLALSAFSTLRGPPVGEDQRVDAAATTESMDAAVGASTGPDDGTYRVDVPGSPVHVSTEVWSAVENPEAFAENFVRRRRRPGQVLPTQLVVYKVPMTPDRRIGRRSNRGYYQEAWVQPPPMGDVVLRQRIDFERFWLLIRQTYERPSRVAASASQTELLTLFESEMNVAADEVLYSVR